MEEEIAGDFSSPMFAGEPASTSASTAVAKTAPVDLRGPSMWAYIQELRRLVGSTAAEKLRRDSSDHTFPGDHEDRLLVAAYVLAKLRQEEHVMRTWGRPMPKPVTDALKWLGFYYPRLLSASPTPAPDARDEWVDGRYSPSDSDEGHITAALESEERQSAEQAGTANRVGVSKDAADAVGTEEDEEDVGWFQDADARKRVLELSERLQERVVGQEVAVRAAVDLIQLCYAGLRERRGPLGTLLFVGPTGVGKTELAKALAATVFGAESALFRVDMSAFKAKGDVATLIGAPRGYQDSGMGGTLTAFFKKLGARKNAGAVVLLDEVEKAHPEVVDLFLPAFDEGYLVDGRGTRHSCKRVLFVMTSNLGGGTLADWLRDIRSEDGVDAAQVKDKVMPQVRKHLRPELLGRVSEVVCFAPLGPAEVRHIVELQLGALRERLLGATERRCALVWSQQLVERIASEAARDEHGARGIKRVLQARVSTPLAKLLLAAPLREGPGARELHADLDVRGELVAVVLPQSQL